MTVGQVFVLSINGVVICEISPKTRRVLKGAQHYRVTKVTWNEGICEFVPIPKPIGEEVAVIDVPQWGCR